MTPADPLRRGHMRALMRFIDEMPAPAIRVPSYNLAFLPRLQKMTKEEFLAFAESKPLRKEFMLAMGQTGFPQKEMDVAMDRLRRTVVRMDDEIAKSGGPWLLGREISLADVSVMPVIVRLADLRQEDIVAGQAVDCALARRYPRASGLCEDLLSRHASHRALSAFAGTRAGLMPGVGRYFARKPAPARLRRILREPISKYRPSGPNLIRRSMRCISARVLAMSSTSAGSCTSFLSKPRNVVSV